MDAIKSHKFGISAALNVILLVVVIVLATTRPEKTTSSQGGFKDAVNAVKNAFKGCRDRNNYSACANNCGADPTGYCKRTCSERYC
jgi:hypothetical protein